MLDGRGIHPANRQIQIDAAEHVDAGDLLADHVGEPSGRVVMILQHDRAHAVRARHDRRLESVDGALRVVGKGVDVNVDRAHEETVRIVRARSRNDA